jgi:2-keto-4-pentenoate hydratase/2-oxohepta-3-ene-1,7-dioic acid hydratase in catechol pathway
MKLVRFGAAGQERPGLVDSSGAIRDLSAHLGDLAGDALVPENLARLSGLDVASLPLVATSTRLGPCVARVGKIVCVGLNYSDHAAESGMALPAEPVLFMKATSSIIGPDDDVVLPRGSTKSDWEVELGVVIGTTARYVPVERALDCVAGYCIVNDLSEREYQLERGGQWDKGKGCDTFAPIGPWLVTRDEIGNAGNLKMTLDVNGVRRQDGSTRNMVFKPDLLVSYISEFMTLEPGDIISTGTPAGVGLGLSPPVYLAAGDVMDVAIEGLGRQRQRVKAWSGNG